MLLGLDEYSAIPPAVLPVKTFVVLVKSFVIPVNTFVVVVNPFVVPVKTFMPVVDGYWKASHCISAASSMEIALKQYSFSGCHGLTLLWTQMDTW